LQNITSKGVRGKIFHYKDLAPLGLSGAWAHPLRESGESSPELIATSDSRFVVKELEPSRTNLTLPARHLALDPTSETSIFKLLMQATKVLDDASTCILWQMFHGRCFLVEGALTEHYPRESTDLP